MNSADPGSVARGFCEATLWESALWLATTYRCHPTHEQPPIMGLVFANWATGVNLFRVWTDSIGNGDAHDDIRVAVIEGEIPGYQPGYSIRISAAQADWEQIEQNRPAPSQVQRMHPLPDYPDMLQDFKRDYLKHGEFLLAPVILRDDDQLYFKVQAGIIKRECVFLEASEICDGEPDAVVLNPPASVGVVFDFEEDEESP